VHRQQAEQPRCRIKAQRASGQSNTTRECKVREGATENEIGLGGGEVIDRIAGRFSG